MTPVAAGGTRSVAPVPGPTSRRFRIALLLILVVAGAVRTTFILAVARHDHTFYDAGYYELQARQIGEGHGYNDPFQFLPGAPHQLAAGRRPPAAHGLRDPPGDRDRRRDRPRRSRPRS